MNNFRVKAANPTQNSVRQIVGVEPVEQKNREHTLTLKIYCRAVVGTIGGKLSDWRHARTQSWRYKHQKPIECQGNSGTVPLHRIIADMRQKKKNYKIKKELALTANRPFAQNSGA